MKANEQTKIQIQYPRGNGVGFNDMQSLFFPNSSH